MNRKNEIRRQNFSSEFRNSFVVRNKCEQLKLEKQYKSLDRLREHESLGHSNKRKEMISLQMSLLSNPKPADDNSQELCNTRESIAPMTDIGTRKMKFRSRALSTCTSTSINSLLGGGTDGKQTGSSRLSSSMNFGERKMHPFKKFSRSVSVSGTLGFVRRKEIQSNNNSNVKGTVPSAAAIVDESSSGQALKKILPPIQLTPLHKQKSKSLKELSLRNLEASSRKLSVAQEKISRSWKDLQECRYLRRTSEQYDTCPES